MPLIHQRDQEIIKTLEDFFDKESAFALSIGDHRASEGLKKIKNDAIKTIQEK